MARAATPVGLGVLLGAAFEPLAWSYVVPICLAGLALSLRGLGIRRAGLRGAAFGTAFMLTTLVWLWPSIAPAAWLALSLAQGLWFLVLGSGLGVVRALPGWPLWSAAWWAAVETLRGQWPLGGFPWARLGTTVVDTPWAPLLPLVGTTGTSLALALAGFTLAAVLETASRRRAASRWWAAALVTGVATPALMSVSPPKEASSPMTVAIVQGGVPGDGTDVAGNHRQLTRNQQEATQRLSSRVRSGREVPPELVVWPENSTAVDPFVDAEAKSAIDAAARSIGRPLLLGATVDAADPHRVLSQALVWGDAHGAGRRYTKRHPVPFGEYIPFRRYLEGLHPRFAEIPRDMVPGRELGPLLVNGRSIALAICFDVAYDDVLPRQVRRGAELIVVQTSNAMFTGTSQRAQQFAISRARALETGRSVVIASTNGISGAIGPDGVVLARSRTRGTEVLLARVPVVSGLTPAVRLSTLFPALPFGLAFGASVAGVGRRVRNRPAADRPDLAGALPAGRW